MSGYQVRLTGTHDVHAALQAHLAHVRAQAQAAIEHVVEFTEEDSQKNCPYDLTKPAGEPHLRDSVETEREDLHGKVSYGNAQVTWGPYVHNGTIRMRARPFLFNAYRTGSRLFQDELEAMR